MSSLPEPELSLPSPEAAKFTEAFVQRAIEMGAVEALLEPVGPAGGAATRFRAKESWIAGPSAPPALGASVMRRLLILGMMNLAERVIPQDGVFDARARQDDSRRTIWIHADPVPQGGWKIVLRLMSEKDQLFFNAVEDGDAETVAREIARGRDVNVRNEGTHFPLLLAAGAGHRRVAELLLSAGAEVDAANAAGFTPLMLAARGGCLEVIRLLVQQGADINRVAPRFETCALSQAIFRCQGEAAKLLVDLGADINARAPGGGSMLAYATEHCPAAAAYLEGKGARG